jgi:hypothetical protein
MKLVVFKFIDENTFAFREYSNLTEAQYNYLRDFYSEIKGISFYGD